MSPHARRDTVNLGEVLVPLSWGNALYDGDWLSVRLDHAHLPVWLLVPDRDVPPVPRTGRVSPTAEIAVAAGLGLTEEQFRVLVLDDQGRRRPPVVTAPAALSLWFGVLHPENITDEQMMALSSPMSRTCADWVSRRLAGTSLIGTDHAPRPLGDITRHVLSRRDPRLLVATLYVRVHGDRFARFPPAVFSEIADRASEAALRRTALVSQRQGYTVQFGGDPLTEQMIPLLPLLP